MFASLIADVAEGDDSEDDVAADNIIQELEDSRHLEVRTQVSSSSNYRQLTLLVARLGAVCRT
jgi:hypothetical protein